VKRRKADPPAVIELGGSVSDQARAVKRRAIIEGASEVFATRGFTAGTTTEIAQKVDLSQSALYYYVGSKNDLLHEIALSVAADMSAALDRAMNGPSDPVDQMRSLMTEFTAAVINDRWSFAVYWKERDLLSAQVRNQVERDERRFVKTVEQLVTTLQEQGYFHTQDAAPTVTRAIMGMITWVYQWYRPSGKLNAKQIAKVFGDLIGLPAPKA
jgi:AcrR family transcriptional regulator